MYAKLYAFTLRLWPNLEEMAEQRRMVGVGDVITFLCSLPLAIGGLTWLALETDLSLLKAEWRMAVLFLGLFVLFSRLEYFIIIEIRQDRYGSADGSLASMLQWTAVFLMGASTLWLSVLWGLGSFAWSWRTSRSRAARWSLLRNLSLNAATNTLAFLVALVFYRRWGGEIPLSGLSWEAILPAFGALLVGFFMVPVIWGLYIVYSIWLQKQLAPQTGIRPVLRFLLLALGLPILAHPFAIQGAGIFAQNGGLIFLFFLSGLVMVAFLARRLSWAAESSRQRSRQLEQVEALGREIINSAPDGSELGKLLEVHVPTMFPSARIAIHLHPETLLLKTPEDWEVDFEAMRAWGYRQREPHAFLARDPLPWRPTQVNHDPIVTAPILDVESGETIGCIYVELRILAQPWNRNALTSLFPAAKTLADQVASALHQARIYHETLEYQRVMQELEVAGRIQASFLPNEIPSLDGWELAVSILPARETSGDFFDFIPMGDGRIGIILADVADKGLGAALYMALCRTLLRTYAIEYGQDARPDVVFFSTNERILKDARANLFVTVFFGILDQRTGLLTYANAGHNPPYLFSRRNGSKAAPLSPTGMPIGVEEDAVWQQTTVQMELDDVLVLYTDGIPDAQNAEGDFFREKRLVEITRNRLGSSAQELLVAIMNEIQDFAGDAPQFDDITLLVVQRCC